MRRLNITYVSIAFILTFGLLFGCDEIELGNEFLADPPSIGYTKDSVFSSGRRAKELLWNTYASLPFMAAPTPVLDAPGFKGSAGGRVPIWPYTDLVSSARTWGPYGAYKSGNMSAAQDYGIQWWRQNKYDWVQDMVFVGIRDAWTFIENIDRVPDLSQEEKEQLKGEAKMILAVHYTQMLRYTGGILYVDRAYTSEDDTDLERSTILESVDIITTLIDEAIAVLPLEVANPAVWSGRFTAAGAMALKVKMLSFAAAPLFNSDQPYLPESHEAVEKRLVWTGGYNQDLWVQLRDACEDLITAIEGSSYSLENTGNPRIDYRNGYYERNSSEVLISIRPDFFRYQGQDRLRLHFMVTESWDNITLPLYNWERKFPLLSGYSIDHPDSGYDPQNRYSNRDPRLFENITVNGTAWQGRKAEFWIGGRERPTEAFPQSQTGYRFFKWGLDRVLSDNHIWQWPYVRLSEIYLTYAEALNELNNGPTAEAVDYANRVRDRVGVGSILNYHGKPLASTTKEEFLEALLNERAIEMGLEDNRWFDMCRYKMVETFEAPRIKLNATLTPAAEAINNFGQFFQDNVDFDQHDLYFTYEEVETEIGRMSWQDGWDPKWYLDPFPNSEIQKDYGLVQNPGWELN